MEKNLISSAIVFLTNDLYNVVKLHNLLQTYAKKEKRFNELFDYTFFLYIFSARQLGSISIIFH